MIGNNAEPRGQLQGGPRRRLSWQPIRTAAISLPIISGSNPDLAEETSDSWTVGAVIQPRWIPGLSLSVDYYKIKVNDVIVSLAAQTIVNNCYDQPSLNNVFCALFERNRGTGDPTRSASSRARSWATR